MKVRETAFECIESLRSDDRRGLLIMGPVGTGKTSLMWLIVRELWAGACDKNSDSLEYIRKNEQALVNWNESWISHCAPSYQDLCPVLKHDQLIQALRDYNKGMPEYGLEFPRELRAPLVCIDDLGVGYDDSSGWNLSLQEQWFDYRWENGLPIIATTNKGIGDGPNSLRNWPGWGRIIDRLLDPAFSIIVAIPGQSKRRGDN